MGRDRRNCPRSCAKRVEIGDKLSAFNAGAEAIRRKQRVDEPNRPTIKFQLNAKARPGDAIVWRTELAAAPNISSSSESINLDEKVAIPLIDDIVALLIKDEELENNDLSKIRQVGSSFATLAEAFDRVADNGGTIADDDQKAIHQAANVILQLAFYSDLVEPD